MSNYEHYQSTVEQVYRAIIRKVAKPWHIEYLPSIEENLQTLRLVSPQGTICQRLTLPMDSAEKCWPNQSDVSQQVTEFVVRGATRLAPLRQSAFRNNFPYWLETCLQQLHALCDVKEKLTEIVSNARFPFPSQVNIEGNYLPCWVWSEDQGYMAVSVVDRRTGRFTGVRHVESKQLIDQERWLGAQVIDSVEEAVDTIEHYVSELVQSQKKDAFEEPSLADAINNPCAATLSPVASVALTMAVVAGFFITFKWLLGF
ncbi:hypothetical protein [Photobacterium lutimaris]|uniref:Uncharacterized protein n=1 Tax=Photobacterium lutimaris TaxID=388278 RepID=A0A2T3IHT4_9GAMM|nr:hypothetical protein [Photobacterium lutimaris]PSU27870.1 hypothetical protein C9I99_26695 [Photobacterium lutimaris]TDR69916.1 hypothetical protein DFP78_1271 [Photobacterium lutimaris]